MIQNTSLLCCIIHCVKISFIGLGSVLVLFLVKSSVLLLIIVFLSLVNLFYFSNEWNSGFLHFCQLKMAPLARVNQTLLTFWIEFRFWFPLWWFFIINNLIIIKLINIIIISGQGTVNFDSLCYGPQSRTRLNQKKHFSIWKKPFLFTFSVLPSWGSMLYFEEARCSITKFCVKRWSMKEHHFPLLFLWLRRGFEPQTFTKWGYKVTSWSRNRTRPSHRALSPTR